MESQSTAGWVDGLVSLQKSGGTSWFGCFFGAHGCVSVVDGSLGLQDLKKRCQLLERRWLLLLWELNYFVRLRICGMFFGAQKGLFGGMAYNLALKKDHHHPTP